MDLIKYDMTDIWAVAGDVIAPDSTKIRQGWGVEVVPRQWWNWFENRQDTNIAYMLQKGIPEWDATTEYIANKSYVQRNGVVYKATATSTNNDPVNLTAWVRAFATYTTSANALGGTTAAADRLPYFTSATAASTTTLTAWARTLLDDADAAAGRATLNAQVAHQNLTGLSGVAASVNGVPYFTATTGAMGIATLTAFGRTLFGAADADAARVALQMRAGAIYDVTLNQMDTTPSSDGRLKLMRVGDFGVGTTSAPQITNADTLTVSGVYHLNTGVAAPIGYPTDAGGSNGMLFHQAWGSDAAASQTFITTALGQGRVFVRSKTSGVWQAWKEVWTTTNLVKTSNSQDSTPGSMLKVGDFGFGKDSVTITDPDTVYRGSGFYDVNNSTTWAKRPVAGWTRIFHQSHANTAGYATQIATGDFTGTYPRLFTRICNSGTWTNWFELYTTANSQGLVDQVAAGIQTKLDAKLNKAGDTMTGKLFANAGVESRDEIVVRGTTTDSPGVTIINNAWEVHTDVYGDTWRFFSNRVNNNTGYDVMAFNMANQSAQVWGNNIWHSGNFTPGNYATIDYANNIANSTANNVANSIVQNYAYSKTQSDQKYYINGAGSLVVNNGSVPTIAAATSEYAPQSLRIGNNGNNAASSVMSFLRDGSFGCFFGLNTDNNLAWGGWSHGNVAYKIYSERDFNIANYSTNNQNNAYFLAQGQFNSFYTNLAVNTGAEETGCYAALGNISGGTHGLNTIASGNVLRRGGTNGATSETVPGNWRCMGLVQNGVIGLYKRYN